MASWQSRFNMWITRLMALLLGTAAAIVGYHALLSSFQTFPLPVVSSLPLPSASRSSSTPPVTNMNQPLTHTAVQLILPYYPWQTEYNRVRTDPNLGLYLDSQMIPALEASGDPIQRLTKMANAATAARVKLAEAGRQADFSFNGLDPVEIDLRVAFFVVLSQQIAESKQGGRTEKIEALKTLIAIVHKPYPVGIPEPSEQVSWTATAQLTAETAIQVHLEALEIEK